MKLIFEDYDCNTRKIIGSCSNEQEANQLMQVYISKNGFKSYYIRKWTRPNTNHIVYDYGSHTKFFILEP